MDGLIVLLGLGERDFGGVPVVAGESNLGDTVGFGLVGPVVCGERAWDDVDAGGDSPEMLSKGLPGD
jgi:hypothetical protein